jgi:hypothetical protein
VKNKVVILYILAIVLVLSGCAKEKNASKIEVPIEQDKTLEFSEIEQDSNFEGAYYKTEIENISYDTEIILRNLISNFDINNINHNESPEGIENYVEINNIRHAWVVNEHIFNYYNNKEDSSITSKEEAQKLSDNLVERLGYDEISEPTVTISDEIFYFEYSLQYKGSKILGKESINLANTGGENFITGEYIEVSVQGNQIKSIYLSNLRKTVNVVKEYNGVNDFINYSKLKKILSTYMKAFYKEFGEGITGSYEVNKTEVIYMPYIENNTQFLIPVIKVEGINTINKKDYDYIIYLDAVTGNIIYTS